MNTEGMSPLNCISVNTNVCNFLCKSFLEPLVGHKHIAAPEHRNHHKMATPDDSNAS
jgi:hypothetical protein